MRRYSRLASLTGLAVAAALFTAACTSAAATPLTTVQGATSTPTDVAAAVATPTAVPAAASLTIGSTASATMGDYLTGQNGMTLYILKTDKPDSSTCSGSCATNWPPLTVPSATTAITGPASADKGFATISRADGTIQVTYNHMPLYYFAGDSSAGNTNGQGKNNVWFVAPVSGTVGAGATPAPTSNGGTQY